MSNMVPLKVKISPFLNDKMESLIQDEFFSSATDLVNIVLTEFFSNHHFRSEEENDLLTMNSSILMMLYVTLMDKGVISANDFKSVMEKFGEGEFEEKLEDMFGGLFDELFEEEFEFDEEEVDD